MISLLTPTSGDWREMMRNPTGVPGTTFEVDSAIRSVLAQVAEATVAMMARTGAPPHWGGFLAVEDDRRIVGTCGFTAAPDADGLIEIAYFTFEPFEGRGFGSVMARRLVETATHSGAVRTIRAHTLPRENASTAILRKLEFSCVGPALDPEHGEVWRWEFSIPAQRARPS